MSSDQSAPPSSILDPYEYLQIKLNPDGTLTRNFNGYPSVAANPDPDQSSGLVLSKDIPINQSKNTWARIYLPRQALDASNKSKLPLIVYYHGGGFILLSAAHSLNHDFCSSFATELPALIISVEYRLAPEHRLPAAYDDAVEALHAIKSVQDEWLREYADFSNCFLMGSSAGGNIAYHAGLRAAEADHELKPLRIRGLILHHPYFGGILRSGSEVRLMNDPRLPLAASDLMWELSLPIGADRDHEYCNPAVDGGASKLWEKMKLLGWKVVVFGCEGDPLVDRQKEIVKLMEEKGVKAAAQISDGGHHGIECFDASSAKAMQVTLKDFVFPSV